MTPRTADGARSGRRTIATVRTLARDCRRCDLWRNATQTVFGEGPETARVMLVGEQPGDVEDRQGHPFVGPAGQLLRGALVEADIDPAAVYLTNSVKHFKWEPRGKRRIHQRPNRVEILACHLWLEDEIAIVKPEVLIALGATAAEALFGSKVRVMRDRGQRIDSPLAPVAVVTVHPSSILRSPDAGSRRAALELFIRDLKTIVEQHDGSATSRRR